MDKIIVDVFVPMIGKSYDFILPLGLSLKAVKELIAKVAAEHEDMDFDEKNEIVLINDEGHVLPDEITVGEARLQDGCRLTVM